MRLIDADALMGVDIKIGHIGEKTVRAIQRATVDAFYRNIDELPHHSTLCLWCVGSG